MQAERQSTNPWLIVGIVVASVVSAAAIGLFTFTQLTKRRPPTPVPTSFAAYTAPDQSFVCVSPDGWSKSEGSANAIISGATFKRGDAKIDITSDLVGSLMGDIAKPIELPAGGMEGISATGDGGASGAAGAIPGMEGMVGKRRPAVETIHLAELKTMQSRYDKYEEGDMQTLQSSMGDARFTEFTADGGFLKSKTHGYRVTVLGTDRRISVICQCPEGDWTNLKPAFEQVVTSLKRGSG